MWNRPHYQSFSKKRFPRSFLSCDSTQVNPLTPFATYSAFGLASPVSLCIHCCGYDTWDFSGISWQELTQKKQWLAPVMSTIFLIWSCKFSGLCKATLFDTGTVFGCHFCWYRSMFHSDSDLYATPIFAILLFDALFLLSSVRRFFYRCFFKFRLGTVLAYWVQCCQKYSHDEKHWKSTKSLHNDCDSCFSLVLSWLSHPMIRFLVLSWLFWTDHISSSSGKLNQYININYSSIWPIFPWCFHLL